MLRGEIMMESLVNGTYDIVSWNIRGMLNPSFYSTISPELSTMYVWAPIPICVIYYTGINQSGYLHRPSTPQCYPNTSGLSVGTISERKHWHRFTYDTFA